MKGDDWIQGMSGDGIPWVMIPSPGFSGFLPKEIWGIGAWLWRFEEGRVSSSVQSFASADSGS